MAHTLQPGSNLYSKIPQSCLPDRFLCSIKWQNMQAPPKIVQSSMKNLQATPKNLHLTPKIVQNPNSPPTNHRPLPPKPQKKKAPPQVTFPKTPNPAAHL
jgi:hypothetical protein